MSEESRKIPEHLADSSQEFLLRLRGQLRWLVCPVCHGALDAEDAAIRCLGCRRLYPIVDGLPVLLLDRAV
jgi:hypothetical protein